MFDLFHSRAKAMRYLLIVLLSLVALSMVVTLIPGFGSGMSSRSNDQVLAEVGDEVVTQRMVAQVIQAQMRNQQMSPQLVEMMLPQIVNQIVGELATAYEARRIGLKVTDQELISQIQMLMPHLFQGGEFMGKDAYQATLAQMNSSIPEFENKVRQNVLLEKLQRIAFDGIVVAPSEVDAELARKGEKAHLKVVKFDPEDIKKTLKPTKDELVKFMNENAAAFQTPAKRNIGIIIADADKLGESLPITDAMIQQAYSSQMDRWRTEERAKVRHILVKADQNASADDKKKARAKAEDLLKQLKGGADFAELAKKNSDDPGSGQKGGDLDWVQKGQTVKPFEDTAFALKPKELSGIVETVFGYHIIQTMEKQPAKIKPLDDVRAELLSEIRKRQLFDKMPQLIEAAHAELVKAPTQGEAVAKKFGLQYVQADKVAAGADYPQLGKNLDLDGNLAALAKGGVTPVIQTKENKLLTAAVLDVMPPKTGEFEEVKDQVKTAYLDRKARELSESRAKEFEAKLKANANDLEKTAKELSAKVIDTDEFGRGEQMKDIGPAAYFGEQTWTAPVGSVVGIYRVGSVPYFFKILSRKTGDISTMKDERPAMISQIKERKLRERRELFEEGLIGRLKADGKVKVHEDAIKRMASAYRGA